MYASLLEGGSYETTLSAYDWVEWDELDEAECLEADRCYKLLMGGTLE